MKTNIVERKRLELPDNPQLLSPPIITEPLYQCATAVTVTSYVLDADIEIEVAGVTVASINGGLPWPEGVTAPLPNALITGQKVRARQKISLAVSDWSAIVIVKDHTKDYPAGPPRPEINPAPVFECGIRTGVSNLLTGGNIWITADQIEVGRVNGCSTHQGVNVSPAYGLVQKVRAWFELCKDPSPPSIEYVAGNPSNPLPAPNVDPIFESGAVLTVKNIVNGAKVTVYRNGVNQGTWPCWGGSIAINELGPFVTGDKFTAIQSMCSGNPDSPPGDGVVQPCSSLPAPEIGPVQAGDSRITVTQFVADAIIKVYLNGGLVGASGGSIIILTNKVALGDTLIVVQDLNKCKSNLALEVKVQCVDPPVASNPSTLNLFPVGFSEYQNGGIKGSVYYPAEDDGKQQPFNVRLASLGRVPIVFMAHGNHSPADPSYLGYDYFQYDLAKMGIIAVSVDCNALNGSVGGLQNIEDRADLIIDNIVYFQGLGADPSSIFFERINFNLLGLMGHSRGGDAVVTVPSVINLPGVSIKSVLALAPTNARKFFGLSTIRPKGYAFMTILPAGDGDLWENFGAQFYDQAIPTPFKSQLYVHYTNHNFFNRQWLEDDSLNTPPQPAVITRSDHEHILTAYGCALFRATLLGQATTGYLEGTQLPAGVLTQHVYRSYEHSKVLTVDNHEDGNTININSLGQPTAQLNGMSADEFPFDRVAGAFNSSFYGLSIGMVARPGQAGRVFRSELAKVANLSKKEIWIRAAEVTDGSSVATGSTGFELGLEDSNGVQAWVDSDDIGGLPRPYARNPGMIKTMLNTLRFKVPCFKAKEFRSDSIQAILIRCNRNDERALAFDDLQIIN
jgi:hypothetical protein